MGDEVPLTCDRLPSYFSRLGPFSVFGFRPFLEDVPWPLLARHRQEELPKGFGCIARKRPN